METNTVAKLYHQTPEYSVPYKNMSKSFHADEGNGSVFSPEYLDRSYQKFVSFKKDLREIGFLSDDLETMGDFQFKSIKENTRAIPYELTSFKRYGKERDSRAYSEYNYTPVTIEPIMPLFNTQIQFCFVTSLPHHSSELMLQAFNESDLAAKHAKLKPKALDSNYSFEHTLDFLTSLRDVITEEIESYGYVATPDKVSKALALDRFVSRSYGVDRLDPETHKKVSAYIYELTESDANTYPCLFALSAEVNNDFAKTKEFALPVNAVVELNDIPEFLLFDAMG
jgi:hypothetical protein